MASPTLLSCNFPRIMFIDMNSFFASVEQQERPPYRNTPTIVVPCLTNTTCAISASYEARQFGIKTGTMVGEAKQLCPGLNIVEASHTKYVEYHNALIEILEHYFADIQTLSVDEMACTLGYRHQTRTAAEKLAEQVKAHIARSLGAHIRCSIGIAPNIFLAKVASDFRKPDGLTVFEGNYSPLLCRLELVDLPGIASRTFERLKAQNIYTVSDLWNSPPKKLRAAWGGVVGERWYYMLRGNRETDYGMHQDGEKKSVSHSHVLPPEFRHIRGVRDILLRLTSKALKRLRIYNQEACTISFCITYRHINDYKKRVKWHQTYSQEIATNDDLFWLPLLEQWTNAAPTPEDYRPAKASICFHNLSSSSTQQTNLFDNRERFINLFHAIDSLNTAYGYSVDIAKVFYIKKHAPFRIAFGNLQS